MVPKTTEISESQDSETATRQTDAVDEEPGLTKDEIFHVLQNERRRRVLQYLTGHGEEVGDSERFSMRDIAEQVAAWENDTTVEALTSTQRQRVYIALYQSHLPKLDSNGLINYNQDRGIVERLPLVDEVITHLDDDAPAVDEPTGAAGGPADTDESRWQQSYLGMSALSFALLLGGWLRLFPVSVLSGLELATLLTVVYTATGGAMTVLSS